MRREHSIELFLARLRELDVELWPEGERLRYEAPRGVMTRELQAELRRLKGEVLSRLRRTVPLSFAQRRLWFLDQLEPESAAYHVHTRLTAQGDLDLGILAGALGAVARRQEALRTTFVADAGGEPEARIAAHENRPGAAPLPFADLSGLPPRRRAGEAHRALLRAAREPFDLARGPLLRTVVLRREPRHHDVLLTLHHIIADVWSVGVLIGEIAAFYRAACRGGKAALPPLSRCFADFVREERRRLSGARLQRLLEYWRRELEGAPPRLEWPTDRPRPVRRRGRGGVLPVRISALRAARLGELARPLGATLFPAFLAIFAAWLHRLSGQRDLVIGTPVANRRQVEHEAVIGFFANTLALRSRLDAGASWRDAVAEIRGRLIAALDHQDLPFERLVEELRPSRDLAATPIFQAALAWQNAPVPEVDLPDLTLCRQAFDASGAKFDLALTLSEERSSGDLAGFVEWDADLYDPTTVARWLGHLTALFDAALEEPGRPLESLPLLSLAERHPLLHENDPPRRGRSDAMVSLPALFAGWAHRAPERPAVEDGAPHAATLCYSELAGRARRLAGVLRKLGVGPEERVGLCLERTPELVVAVLAVTFAGAAYVPLDPAYPEPRLRFMLADAAPAAVIADEVGRGVLPADLDLPLVDAEEARDERSPVPPPMPSAGDHALYVVYTSGSTGRPKGVVVSHRAVHRLFFAADGKPAAYAGLGPGRRVGQAASPSFDAFTFELWGALVSGATLVLVPRHEVLMAERLAAFLTARRVEVLFSTTALFQQTVAAVPAAFAGLETLLVGGEAADPRRFREVLEQGAPRRLMHVYGPTETTTFASFHHVRAVPADAATVPIGRGLEQTRLVVVDRLLELVPLGVWGELGVGGAGLARGYRGRAAATAARFVPDPWSADPGARLYLTGDVVRRHGDGAVEFVGRLDQQVKIRGFRIEPGEIESALAGHEGVSEAAVSAIEGGERHAEKQLVAHVAPRIAGQLDAAALESFLAQRLPAHMLPSFFVFLDALPKTANGKLDRRALPAPASADRARAAWEAPATRVEERLAAVWAEFFGGVKVGRNDDFFALGGHSLAAVRLLAKARRAGLVLDLHDLFERPTLAALAAVTRDASAHARSLGGAMEGEYPLIPGQHYFFGQDHENPSHRGIVRRTAVPGGLAVAAARRAVAAVLRHHDGLRSRFVRRRDENGGGWAPRIAPTGSDVPFTRVDASSLSEEAFADLLVRCRGFERCLDIEHGPLFFMVYLERDSARGGEVVLVIHHLVTDELSNRLLEEDLWSAYAQAAAGRAIRLPPKSTSILTWAKRLAEYAASPRLLDELPWWTSERRRGVPPLPQDHPAGANTDRSGRLWRQRFTAGETRALLAEVPRCFDARLDAVILALLRAALAEWSDHRLGSTLVDLVVHGRHAPFEDVDLLRTVGWLSIGYPLRLDLPGYEETPLAGLRAVEALLAAVPMRGFGFSLLYLREDPAVTAELEAMPRSPILLNVFAGGPPELGEIDESEASLVLLEHQQDFPDKEIANLDAERSHLLHVNAAVIEGRLELEWWYSSNRHQKRSIRRLAEAFRGAASRLSESVHGETPATEENG